MIDLDSIEWHDLPLESIRIGHDSIELTISVFDETTQEYLIHQLKLVEFTALELSIKSKLTIDDLLSMEVSKFDYLLKGSSLSGTIGILPKNAGFWTIEFENALWDLSLNSLDS